MSSILRIGMIGLDTSHAVDFTELLNDPNHQHHVPGARVTVAFPGGSPDFELSAGRVEGFTETLRSKHGVEIVDTPEAVAERCDAILLESVDGRVHLEQFRRIAPYGKPVFIDKPLAVSSRDAEEIARVAEQHGVEVMSCSAVRFAQTLTEAVASEEGGAIIGADCYGPMDLQPTQPGLFWYGVHTADMLYAAMGTGCIRVQAHTNDDDDLIVGTWADGRIGTIRGNRRGNRRFGVWVHRQKKTLYADVYASDKPYYALLLESIVRWFAGGRPAIDLRETLEVVRFMEAANESRVTGQPVSLGGSPAVGQAAAAREGGTSS
ncbi:Gfo/Idh/MocA family protein [Paenibacillus sp. A3]|uniref:Gfo/Idh/MocA family protein n=1 Tax=Paenibacillus sp. A3 TaxID=1337054 RepID=UPI0006D57D2E|nr:Gfo/Idh/MocA family oxidoreductase [Paenibacillus sp. A3]